MPSNKNLEDKIKATIKANGPIGIDVFMQFCLYDPLDGYYINKNPIGSDGDFITAPEISQMFGEMIAVWVISSWYNLGSPESFNLVELGAGRGTLMRDVLRSLKISGKILDCIKVNIIESNKNLIRQQKDILDSFDISWHQNIKGIIDNSPNIPLIIIANEFLDCLPIKQFIKTDNGWCEVLIGLNSENKLVFGLSVPTNKEFEKKYTNDEKGSIIETSSPVNAFVENICDALNICGGYALFIDYGYDNHQNIPSFQSLYQHKRNNPLENIGAADLTAHIDFMEIARICKNKNTDLEGPITQADFLKAMGIVKRAEALIKQNPNRRDQIFNDLKRLIDKSQMGELFKVISIKNLKNAPNT